MKRIHLFFLTIFLFCGSSFAQNPAIDWQKCLGGSNYEEAYSILQTTDGGFIVAGYSHSNDGDVTGNHGEEDYWIVKLSSLGNIQWQKCIGGSSDERAESIQQTSDGGFIIAGYSYSNDGDVNGNHGISDYWIVKLSSLGNIQWQKCYGGSSDERAESIQQTIDGGFIVAGYSSSNDGDVTGNHGNNDYWVLKLNSSGTIQWQKCLGGTNLDWALSIQQTIDNGYIIAGFANSNDGDVTGHHGSTNNGDYWIIKLNSSGSIEWQKSLGGSLMDWAFSIRQTIDEGFVAVGISTSIDGDVTDNHGGSDYWIVKINSLGGIEWQKSYGGSENEGGYSIQQTSDGGYIVAGDSKSNDGDVSGHHGSTNYFDYWIVKLNSSGVIQWQKSLGGSGQDYAISIQQTSEGVYIVAGMSESVDGDVTGNHGHFDYWIVKLEPNASIEEINTGNNTILLHPNPANSLINIKLQASSYEHLSIYNTSGQEIMKLQDVKQNKQIDISKLPSGLYYIKVQSDKGMAVGKFVKQ